MEEKMSYKKALPVLLCFFVMGVVDLIGISTNYVKQDFTLNDTVANLLTLSMFLWFAVLSAPTGAAMNRWGRKRTVLFSMAITLIGMTIPFAVYNFPAMLVTFALLGIGNTILQVSLNPLLTNVVGGGRLTSSLTLGQFIKAIAAFLGPIVASRAVLWFGDWKLVFAVYGATTVLFGAWLLATPIREERGHTRSISLGKTFELLKDKMILLFFVGIIFVVGIDVGLNTTIPKLLMERCGMPLEEAGLGTSLYFIARTIGSFVGAILLVYFSSRRFFAISMFIAIPAMILMLLLEDMWSILATIFIVGFSVANVFSIIFAFALKRLPEKVNETSGLMIMGVAGGAVIPPLMGIAADLSSQSGAMFILLLLMGYLLYCSLITKEEKLPNV